MAKDQLKEHISRIMSKSKYVLESPSYRAVIDDDYGSYDDPTTLMGGPQPVDGNSPLREADPLPNDDEGGDEMGGEQPQDDVPEVGGSPDEIPSPEGEPEMGAPVMGGEVTTPSPDELQNEIIKKNIDVMKQLNQKIEDLEMSVNQLNSQNQETIAQNIELKKDVEEVREPTNVEKLMSRKEDSHPYYYGLNDMWKGNWFQARRDDLGEKGMKQLEDGSYVADFDELPMLTTQEIKDSFNSY